jgi:hypothetical protein
MKNINLKTSLLLIVGISIITLFILARYKAMETFTLQDALKMVPKIVTIDMIIIAAFSSYLWKWKIFKGWLVPFPNLNGTWKGEIHSTWQDPVTGQRPDPIPTILTIKQSFFKVSCVMRTGEMTSHSCIADFILNKEDQVKRLCYTYDSNPISKVKERSPQHCGTTVLDIIENSTKKLRGHYWTGRKTTGDITLEFWNKEILDEYPTELGEHPVSKARENKS